MVARAASLSSQFGSSSPAGTEDLVDRVAELALQHVRLVLAEPPIQRLALAHLGQRVAEVGAPGRPVVRHPAGVVDRRARVVDGVALVDRVERLVVIEGGLLVEVHGRVLRVAARLHAARVHAHRLAASLHRHCRRLRQRQYRAAAGQRRCTFVTRIGVPCWQVVKTPGCSTPVTRTGTPTGTSAPSTRYVAPPAVSTLQPGSTPASTTPSRVTGRPVSLGPPGLVGRGAAGVEGVAGPGGLVERWRWERQWCRRRHCRARQGRVAAAGQQQHGGDGGQAQRCSAHALSDVRSQVTVRVPLMFSGRDTLQSPAPPEVSDGRSGSTDVPARRGGGRRRRRARRAVPGLRRPAAAARPRTRAAASCGRCRTCATARCGSGCRQASSTARSTTPSSRSCSTTAPRCPAGTTAWPPSTGRGGTRRAGPQPRGQQPRRRRSATPSQAYDPMAQGGTTTVEVTRHGEVLRSYTSLNGTQMNCSGGPMPWGSWVTCEETVNGPDVGPDFTGVSNVPLTQPHGFIFEVPGRRAVRPRADHRGRAVRPRGGRVRPARRRALPDRGQLRLPVRLLPLPAAAQPDAHRPAGQRRPAADAGRQGPAQRSTSPPTSRAGRTYQVEWVDIDDPAPTFPYTPGQTAPTTNDKALTYVGNQGRAQGAAYFSRLEGAAYDDGVVYFTLHPGRRGGGGRASGRSPTGTATGTARSGRTTSGAGCCGWSTSRPGRTRSTSRTTSPPARAARSWSARTTSTTTTCAG